MLKIAIIGDKKTTLPFRGVGMEAIICEEAKEARRALEERFGRDYGIIFIGESLARGCMDMIEELTERRSQPIITIIPDFLKRAPGEAEDRLKNWLKRAVGIDISRMRR